MNDEEIKQMSDETLLDQTNAFDPYDVEFARRFRVQKARIKELEAESARIGAENEEYARLASIYTGVGVLRKRLKDRAASRRPGLLPSHLCRELRQLVPLDRMVEAIRAANRAIEKEQDDDAAV